MRVKKAQDGFMGKRAPKGMVYTESGRLVSKKAQDKWNREVTKAMNEQYRDRAPEFKAPNLYGTAPLPSSSKSKPATGAAKKAVGAGKKAQVGAMLKRTIKKAMSKRGRPIAQDGKSVKGRMMSEFGPKNFSVDTTGYAAGRQKFPSTFTTRGRTSKGIVTRSTVNRSLGVSPKSGVVRQTRAQWRASRKAK